MKKKSGLIAACAISAVLLMFNDATAQITPAKKFNLNLGLETGLPTTMQSNYTSFILGGTIRAQYGITKNLAATFTTGGFHLFPKTIPGTSTSYGSFGVGPVKAGLKQFLIPNYYIGLEAGIGREVLPSGFAGGSTKTLLSPAAGYDNHHWDVALHFESLSGQNYNYGIFGLRIAYGFTL